MLCCEQMTAEQRPRECSWMRWKCYVFLVLAMNFVLVPEWFLLAEWNRNDGSTAAFLQSVAIYQHDTNLKCLAVVLLWKHNTAKINNGALQRKDRRINTGSKMAITFLHFEKFVTRYGSSWAGEGNRDDNISLGWNNRGLQFYLLQEESCYFKSPA